MTPNHSPEVPLRFDSINILVFLFKWRWALVITCLAAAVISAVVSLTLEEKFKSSVVMFPAGKSSLGSQLMEEVQKEDVLQFGEKEEAERLLQILNSDKIRNKIIEKYDLYTHYNIPRDSKGANAKMSLAYDENISSKLTRFGSVRVDVLDKDPKTAMNIANDITALLDTVANELKNIRAREAFNIAQSEYQHLQNEIRVLEDSMGVLRTKGVYDYISQIEGLNEQYATAIGKRQSNEAAQLKKEMDQLAFYGSVYVKLETLIESAYEREAILKKRYELLKIDLNSNLPATFVVDSAAEADKKSYPIRWLIVVMSVFSAFVFGIVAILIFENFKMLRAQNRI
jgi:uncharacterized protein involved in exopolysaccharide biosynthesis